MTWAMDEWREKNKRKKPFDFFGGKQFMPQDQYESIMEKRWRNPWYKYEEQPGKPANPYADKILRDEAMKRSAAEQEGTGPLGFRQQEARRSGMPVPQASTTPQMVESMQSGMQPMSMTQYFRERDTGFAGAMAKTIASGIAKAAKPKDVRAVKKGGGRRAAVEGLGMSGWTGPQAPSAYEETLAVPSIETYLRPWRLKHGYT